MTVTNTELLAIATYMAAMLTLMGLVDGWLERRRQPAAPPPPTNRKRAKEEAR